MFVPKRQFRSRWVRAAACRSCGNVFVVVQEKEPRKPPPGAVKVAWNDLDGESDKPCTICGHYDVRFEEGWNVCSHVKIVTARFTTAWRWWNPLTWFLEGKWEIRAAIEKKVEPAKEEPPVIH